MRYAPAPGTAGFGVLSAMDAGARGILISVFPLLKYRTFASADVISAVYLEVGVVFLIAVLLMPWIIRLVSRRWMFSIGALEYSLGLILILFNTEAAPYALVVYAVSSVTVFVCLNAYVLDYIEQAELGYCKTLRMFCAAMAWTAGPVLGVFLESKWTPLPFLVSAGFGCLLFTAFWWMHLGDSPFYLRTIGYGSASKAKSPRPIGHADFEVNQCKSMIIIILRVLIFYAPICGHGGSLRLWCAPFSLTVSRNVALASFLETTLRAVAFFSRPEELDRHCCHEQ